VVRRAGFRPGAFRAFFAAGFRIVRFARDGGDFAFFFDGFLLTAERFAEGFARFRRAAPAVFRVRFWGDFFFAAMRAVYIRRPRTEARNSRTRATIFHRIQSDQNPGGER